MRLHSTPESVAAGEVTLLAFTETAVATALSVWWAKHQHSFVHFEIAFCLAPILLLRSDRSTGRALRWIEGFQKFLFRSPPITDLDWFIPLLWWPIGIAVIRILAVAVTAMRHPLYCLRQIPDNWKRVTLNTDLFKPPELVPGAGQMNDGRNDYEKIVKAISYTWRDPALRYRSVVFSAASTLVFLPSIAYRFSLKSTWLAYLPLLFIVNDHPSTSLFEQVRYLATSEIEKLKRWYSGFIVVFLTALPMAGYFILRSWWRDVDGWLQSHTVVAGIKLSRLFLFTAPNGIEVDGWHIARLLNAVITLCLWVLAKEKLLTGDNRADAPPMKSVAAMLTIRRTLTVYIIGCTAYIVITTIEWGAIPPVRVRWLPW